MSQLFSQTLREAPADAEMPSHKLLVRAGFIRQLAAGIYTAMPLARRSLTKIENIIRDEMNAIGGQEMTMPVVHPAELWQETERWYQIGSEMGRFKDKNQRDMVLAMTHEEVVADLTRKEIHSYRQLPVMIYHIQTKWRDDPRPRAGLIRVREFTMKDSYTLDADFAGLDRQYRNHYQAYFNIFHRCGIPAIAVKSDVGMMGGKLAHEYMYLTPYGEDSLLLCDECGYSANRQIALFQKQALPKGDLLAIEKVATPESKTIAGLAAFLEIPEAKTAKAVFWVATVPEGTKAVDKFVFAITRGDMELNETKLVNALKASEIRPAREDEIKLIGAVPGYASPVGLPEKNETMEVVIVVDDLIPESTNLVAGANETGYHLKNVNYGRDYRANIVADITAAGDGAGCPRCGASMRTVRGVEVGNIFKLGTRYSIDTVKALKARCPGVRFVWLMGADNLIQMPKWQGWRALFQAVPIAVFARPPYSFKARSGRAARRFARFRVPVFKASRLVDMQPPAWVFLLNRPHRASASNIRARSGSAENA